MKIRVVALGLLVGLSACSPLKQAVVGSNDKAANQVQSFPLDSKEYRYIELDNGIRTLLVSDATAVKSAASLNVDVGSFQDPEGWDGLAHFLEHMLFLGTEKYPAHDNYGKYLEAHGGSRNAYTAFDLTNYHFSIDGAAFEGALDRFSQFFISPLFTEKYVDREKNAVHSEYYTRINKDQIRQLEIFESVINPAHQGAKFNAGNLDTLSDKPGLKARDVLVEFYNKYYSADHMTLTLAGNQSLDELEQLAREKFTAVPVLDSVPETIYPELFTAGELPKVVEIKPVQEQHQLALAFPIPSQDDNALEGSVAFVSHMLSAKSANSLSDNLKAKGWANALQASAAVQYKSVDTFYVVVSMTPEGLKHQDETIASVFDQVDLVKREGVKEWRYNELANLSAMSFQFSENSSVTMKGAIDFANALQTTLPRDLIRSSFKRFDADQINAILDSVTADNMVVMVSTPNAKVDSITKFYDAEYGESQPSAARIASWKQSQFSDLTLPERNPLIPENLDLVDVQNAEQPVKLDNTGEMEIWHYPNIADGIPKATIQLALDRPERMSLEQDITSQIYFALISEQLEQLRSKASIAGMSYEFGAGGVTFNGYSDKLSELANQVLSQVMKPQFSEQQFGRLKSRIDINMRNHYKAQPLDGVLRELKNLLDADSESYEASLNAVANISLEKVLQVPQWLYRDVRMQMMTSGNVTAEQSRNIAGRIQQSLAITSTDRAIPKGLRVVRTEQLADRPVYAVPLEHADAAVFRYYQGRDNSRQERTVLNFLGQLMSQHYFNDLRTEQQLGYIVQTGANATDRTPGIVMLVQSPTVSVADVERATDAFLPKFAEILASMTDAEFEGVKQASLGQLRKPAQNSAEKVSRFWSDLRNDYPQFDSRQQAIAVTEATTLQDVRDAFQAVIVDQPHAISVVTAGAKGGVKATIDSAEQFRKGKEVITRN